jgi:hypothetical protein
MATNHGDSVDWEGIARTQLEKTAKRTADDIETAIRLLGVEIGRGGVDEDHLRDARVAIEDAIYVLEGELAPAVPGDHGRGDTRYVRNDGTAMRYLGLTTRQTNEARGGATIELGTEEIRALCNGSGVQVETPGGIGIELLPAQPEEVNPEP